MNITDQTKTLIATIEKSISDKEKQLSELDFAIKLEKAHLRKIKKAFANIDAESKLAIAIKNGEQQEIVKAIQ